MTAGNAQYAIPDPAGSGGYARNGKVLVSPDRYPIAAMRREMNAALASGDERAGYGLCVALALLTCEPVEELWAEAKALSELL